MAKKASKKKPAKKSAKPAKKTAAKKPVPKKSAKKPAKKPAKAAKPAKKSAKAAKAANKPAKQPAKQAAKKPAKKSRKAAPKPKQPARAAIESEAFESEAFETTAIESEAFEATASGTSAIELIDATDAVDMTNDVEVVDDDDDEDAVEVAAATNGGNGARNGDAPSWSSEFPPVLQSLVDWVNGGKLSGVDFEMYASFNEQYKPSDWTRNPATDSELFSFGMDGTGGQVAIWRNDASKEYDALPIVFLGSEGEVSPLASCLPEFLHELANGYGPLELTSGGDEPTANSEMLAWVKETYPNADLSDPTELFNAAKESLGEFEQHLMAQVKN